jgi:hypothetical protein
MKKTVYYLLTFTLISSFFLTSCNDDDDDSKGLGTTNTIILNYGSYSGSKSTLSAFYPESDTVVNGYFESVNSVDMVSNVQYAYQFNNKIYFMGNNSDQIFYVDDNSFAQTQNGISGDSVVKPRYCVGQGDYLYVSCWGGNIWNDPTLSYILKINVTNNTIEDKITLHGGPEGLAIAHNKLYAALNYKDSVAVVQLDDHSISYIETPAVSTYFLQDASGNLYVSLISSSVPSTKTGLGYINTTNDELESVYELDGISTSYVNTMSANSDFSKIYVVTSAYDANYNISGGLAVFDVADESFESELLVDGISGINGVATLDDNIYVFVSESVTSNGSARQYTSDGTFVKAYETGIAPFMMLTVE